MPLFTAALKASACGAVISSKEASALFAQKVSRRLQLTPEQRKSLVLLVDGVRYGLTQVVFHPETAGKELLDRASHLGNEWVIAVRGTP